ncbi:MAG: helix-turn-helix transcriptional regulator [Candidatus Eremiobacteraeota bacterium]|nr:helix-turn-helix transcriptional regulator [Candidatus Eremiobacteraeota bacterium]
MRMYPMYARRIYRGAADAPLGGVFIISEPAALQTGDGCRCDGGQPKNFMRPCILLLLKEEPAHGYDLLERLRAFNLSGDPGGLYRLLRALEREGFVRSWWESGSNGHDRRAYSLTPLGEESLHAWAAALDASRRVLEVFRRRVRRANFATPSVFEAAG